MPVHAQPNLFIVGVPRAATTSLAAALDTHPDIAVCAMKEPHFFVFPPTDESFSGPGDDWVLRNWTSERSAYDAAFAGAEGSVVVDASTNYFHTPHAIERIVAELPDARFVVVLRRPEDRARSAHRFLRWQGHEQLDFADALAAEGERRAAGWSRIWRYAEDSHYADSLERMFALVEPQRAQVVLFDDLRSDWDGVSARLQEFLAVAPRALQLEQLNQKTAPPPKALAWLLNRPSDLRTRVGDSPLGPVLAPLLQLGRRLASSAPQTPEAEVEPVPPSVAESWNRDLIRVEALIGRSLTHWRS